MDLLAAGVYDLGLTAAEFSSFTPRHIDHFYKRHLAAETRRMLLTCWYANVNRDRDKHPAAFTMEDFVPGATKALTRISVVDLTDANEAYKLRTEPIETQMERFRAFGMTAWGTEPNG